MELQEQQKINADLQQVYQEVIKTLQDVKEERGVLGIEVDRRSLSNIRSADIRFALLFNITDDNFRRPLHDSPPSSNHSSVLLTSQTCPPNTAPSAIDHVQSLPKPNGLLTDATFAQLELVELQHRYDALLDAKEKAAARYKKDYKKWREYKRQMYEVIQDKKKQGHRRARSSAKRKKQDSMGIHGDENTKLSRTYSLPFLCASYPYFLKLELTHMQVVEKNSLHIFIPGPLMRLMRRIV